MPFITICRKVTDMSHYKNNKGEIIGESIYHSLPISMKADFVRVEESDRATEKFIVSAAIGAVTGSTLLGGILGGDFIGGAVGDIFEGGGLFD
jgi:hypothetical protein